VIIDTVWHYTPKRVNPLKYLNPDYPIVVLINHTSSSASEIFAGAMKNTHSATLVGQTTFGKGLVQTVFQRPQDNSAIKITTHKYLTSNGHDINRYRDRRGGVAPDVTVDISEDDFIHRKDTQLQKALEIVQQKTGYVKPAAPPAPAPASVPPERPNTQPE